MSRIIVQNLNFSYNDPYYQVFRNITFNIDTEWKLAVIGRNGIGKTTLLKLINGDLCPDSGEIKKKVKTQYFPYVHRYEEKYKIVFNLIKECVGNYCSMEEKLDIPEILEEYIRLGGFTINAKIKREIKKIGLKEKILEKEFSVLSSGEKIKISLIILFMQKEIFDGFILLDEPTNHLDSQGEEEVIRYLKSKKGFMLISHKKTFIDQVADHILYINKYSIDIEKGNYSTWKKNKDMIEEYELKTELNIKNEIKKLERSMIKKENWAIIANKQKCRFAANNRTNGTQAYSNQVKRAKKRIESDLEKKKNLLKNYEVIKKLEINQLNIEEDWLIKVQNLNYSYNQEEILLSNISFTLKCGERLWIRGQNGTGKTTLLKLISKELYSPSIRYNEGLLFSILKQELNFEDEISGKEFLKKDCASNFQYEKALSLCDIFDLSKEDLEKSCNIYSSGQKKKILLAKVLSQENHIIILDEPLNYMDNLFREQLEKAIIDTKPTMIFIEHDIKFGEKIATKILNLD